VLSWAYCQPCVVVTNAFLCYVQALAGYPAIDWTRMVYDGSRALGFRVSWRKADDITQYQVRGFLVIWCRHTCRIFLTTAGSLLFFAGPRASSTMYIPGRWG
jgi:hypothetical protein